jgi:hypothetical protein
VIEPPDQPEHRHDESDDAEHCEEITHVQQYRRRGREPVVNGDPLRVNEA